MKRRTLLLLLQDLSENALLLKYKMEAGDKLPDQRVMENLDDANVDMMEELHGREME